MITTLDEFGTDIINEICNNYDISEDLTLPSVNECELPQTINPMRHIKLIIRFLMKRAPNKIRTEIGQERYDFFKDTGTRNGVFMIRMI